MWPLSTPARLALGRSHSVAPRVTAYTAAYGLVPVPITSGSVTVDSGSQVRRTGSLGVPLDAYWPGDDPWGVLSPLGTEIGIEYGIALGRGAVEWVPVFRGPITDVSRKRPYSAGDALSVSLADRSQLVADARLELPRQIPEGASVVTQIGNLITEVLPNATVVNQGGSGALTAATIDVDKDRWSEGVEKLSDAIVSETFCNPLGDFVIRPWPAINSDRVVWTLRPGDGGSVISFDQAVSRQDAFSKVVVTGAQVDGKPPVWASTSDLDPTSPTYRFGPFGLKTAFYSSDAISTIPAAQAIADQIMADTRARPANISISALVNPAFDAGDVVLVLDETGLARLHRIESLTIPLTTGETQQLTTRSVVWPDASVQGQVQ